MKAVVVPPRWERPYFDLANIMSANFGLEALRERSDSGPASEPGPEYKLWSQDNRRQEKNNSE